MILALRALGLGDLLTGVPALRALRRRHPTGRLVLAAPDVVGSWLVTEGVVDAVLPADGVLALDAQALVRARARHPDVLGDAPVDLAVNLHGNGDASTAALAALRPRRLVGYAGSTGPPGSDQDAVASDGPACDEPAWDAPPWDPPPWNVTEHEVARWCRLVDSLDAGRPADSAGPADSADPADLVLRDVPLAERRGLLVLHPGAASPSRRWPAERWARLAVELAGQGDVVLTGSAAERSLCAGIARAAARRGVAVRDSCGQLPLGALTDLVAHAALLVCGDTGVGHLATATRTPSVLLFGPTPPSRWGPCIDTDRHEVLWPAPPGYTGDPHGARVDSVLAGTTVADVLAACRRLTGSLVAAGPATTRP